MSGYELIRMPTDEKELSAVLEELTPFLDAMYTEDDEALFGEVNFILDHWLFLWDTGAGYFLVQRDQAGAIKMVAMLTQFRDLWHGRPRVNIQRMAIADDTQDARASIFAVIDYLKSVASLMRFDLLYYVSRDKIGNEISELVWNGRKDE